MDDTSYTRTDRVHIDESGSDVYRQLKSGPTTQAEDAPFETFKDIFVLAACLGFRNRRRVPIGKAESEFRVSVFTEDDLAILKALAIAETGDVDVLTREGEVLAIAEEYANAGIHEVRAYLLDEGGRALWNLVSLYSQNLT